MKIFKLIQIFQKKKMPFKWLFYYLRHKKKTYKSEYSRGFGLSKEEQIKFNKWIQKHNKKCKYSDSMKTGAIGGRLTYMFTPTSLGVITKVKCACGEEIDLTDTDLW